MLKIVTLKANPYYTDKVAEWIFEEFVRNSKPGIELENVIETLRTPEKVITTLVALKEEACVGTVSLMPNDLKTRMDLTPWLSALIVDKTYRNEGIGRLLIDQLVQAAQTLGYTHLYLRTEHAAAYYDKLGWQFVAGEKDEHNQETKIFMKKI